MSKSVKVRVRCVVDVPIGQWSADSTMEELSKIAIREGLEKLQQMVQKEGGAVYGTPKPVFVMVEEE